MRVAAALLLAVVTDAVVVAFVPNDAPTNVGAGIMLLGVVAASFLGGRVLGLLAATLAAVTFAFGVIGPDGALPSTTNDIIGAVVYTVVVFVSALIIAALERSVARLRATQSDLSDSLMLAQRALLPGPVPGIEDVALGRYYRPAGRGHAGGDWYTIVPLDEHRIGLGVGDAAGHGLGALSVMARTRFGMLAYALLDLSPASVLEHINHMLCTTTTGPGRFVTATFGVLDRAAMTWTEARAGHPPTVRRSADGSVDVLHIDQHGLVLGVDPDAKYRDVTVALQSGDLIALYTDGLVERPTQSLDQGIAVLAEGLQTSPGEDLDRFCATLADELGTERDDVALLIAAVEPARATTAVFRRSAPAAPEQVWSVRHALDGWLRGQLVDPDDRWAVLLATSEVTTNAIEHGCHSDGVSIVTVTARLRDDWIEVTVHDPGVWASAVSSPERGRGLGMVNTVMDRVNIDSGPDGTTVQMMLLARGAADALGRVRRPVSLP